MRKTLAIAALTLFATIILATRPGSDASVVHAATPSVFTALTPDQVYAVPAGVTRVRVEARGGSGANSACGTESGFGTQVTTILNVTGLPQLFVNVGGNGVGATGGANGGGNGGTNPQAAGGGGGASDVRTTAASVATRVVVAGGGGGAGSCGNSGVSLGGVGGDIIANGGNGFSGINGGAPGVGGGGGSAGTAVAGGAAGTTQFGVATAGDAGGLGVGGNGATSQAPFTTVAGSGGGGGGGFHGGGGGGAGTSGFLPAAGGGGGGIGSSFVSPALGVGPVSTVPHPNRANPVGQVTITPVDPPTLTKTFNLASVGINQASTMTITVGNGTNAFPLTGVAFSDTMPAGVVINTASLGGTCSAIGTVNVTTTSVSLTAGTLAANTSCTITLQVSSATANSYTNTTTTVTTVESAPGNPATAILTVTAAAVATNTPTFTPTATPVIFVPRPSIPQVFQHVPQGIFYGNKNTPTPVIARPAAVLSAIDPGVMPVLRPPSTGDAGLIRKLSIW